MFGLSLGLGLGSSWWGGLPIPITYGRSAAFDAGTVADYYVSPGGLDTNPGTLAQPFATLQKAHDTALAGQTVMARAGVYRQTLICSKQLNWRGYGTELAIQSGTQTITGWAQCTSADQPLVGASFASIYKATFAKTLLPATNFDYYNLLMPVLAGVQLDLASLRKGATPNPWEQMSIDTMFDSAVDGLAFTLYDPDGAGAEPAQYVDTVSFPGLSAYTDAQLAHAYAAIKGTANEPAPVKVASVAAAVLTLARDAVTNQSIKVDDPATKVAAFLNIVGNIGVGQWACTDNGTTITLYVRPADPGQLSGGVEINAVTNLLTVQAAGAGSSFRNFEWNGCADSAAFGVSMVRLDSGAHGVDIQHCRFTRFSHKNRGYGCLYSAEANNIRFSHNDIIDGQNQFGPFFSGTAADGLRVRFNYVRRTSATGFRFYGQTRIAQCFNWIENCGRGAHANKANFYQGCDRILQHGNKFIDSYGYDTIQGSSRILVLANLIPTGSDGRAFDDQSNTILPPVEPSSNYIVNNAFPIAPGATASFALSLERDRAVYPTPWPANPALEGTPLPNKLNWGVYNNLAHDILIAADQLIGRENNVLSKGAPVGAGEVAETDPTRLFTDPSNEDYTTFAGSILRTTPGRSVESIIVEWEGYFPDLNLRQDIDGNAWNPAAPGLGPWGAAWKLANDTTAPALGAPSVAVSGASATVTVTSSEPGTIYWALVAAGGPVPTAAEIIAATGFLSAGNGWANEASESFTITGAAGTSPRFYAVERDRGGNNSAVVSADVPFVVYAGVWKAFDGVTYLRRSTPMAGAQTAVDNALIAFSVRRTGAQYTAATQTGGIMQTGPTANAQVIDAYLNGRARAKLKDNSATAVLQADHLSSSGAADGIEYLFLVDYRKIGAGSYVSNLRTVRVSDGAVIAGDPAQDAGTLPLTFAGTNLFDLFKFNAGLSAERFMLWDNATADVTLAATQELFVKAGGGLADPLTAVNALGTPLISFYGDSLQTGVNAGSGGDWTYS